MNKSSELSACTCVTVGVCVKNCESYIRETIDSILNQDFPHNLMEVIVVDGYSVDRTLTIIKNVLCNSDIKTRIFYENKGLGVARQIVVDNADGSYIVWVDGDVVLTRDFVRTLFEFLNQNPRVGIVKGKQALEPGRNLLGTLETYSRAAGRMVDYQSGKGRSKALGTAGSAHRIEAVRQVGGFSEDLKGYNEDWDLEIRVRAAGWSLCTVNVFYLDYERHGLTWKRLWSRYWLRGSQTHYFLHKNKGLIKHYRMFPPAAVVSGFLYAHKLFKLTHEKTVFLLPVQHLFKMTAWYVGFTQSHMNGYEPKS